MDRFIDRLYEYLTLDKPMSATAQEWYEWEINARTNKPVAFFINETLPSCFRTVFSAVFSPFTLLRRWIRYGIFDKYHVIKTGLRPNYYDADTRMLHGMFNLLVDFVEVEKAWMYVVFDEEARKKYSVPWWSIGRLRFKSFRSAEAGLAHLDWESTLDDPTLSSYEFSKSQAETAREILFLYDWWKNIRPNRPDPYDASGWTAICDRNRNDPVWKRFDFGSQTVEERKESADAIKESRRIDESYDSEDQQMLIRLIKIRKSLWT